MQLLSTRRRRIATAVATAALVVVPLVGAVAASAATATGTVNTTGNPGPALTVRAKPTSTSAAVGSRADGARITIVCQTYGQQVTGTYGTTKIWDKVKSGGYVSDAYIRTGSDGLVAPLCAGSTPPTDPTPSAAVRATIAAAKSMTGKYPYSWGGGNHSGPTKGICCSPSGIDDRQTVGFDCSGLMEYAFAKGAGLRLSSTSRSQYADGPRVPIAQLRAGDLVFWSDSSRSTSAIHHVALYIGGGQVVEADRVSGPDIRVRSFSTGESGVMPSVVRPIH
ncbi:Cell wall-associated hydrolase, NlpC family [Pedococcus dokdonensis]|uniref:Cell wall-associated hydrolase, NlpC family n=1 Tax=Pedococcus dokdonensis TaxID=443156 RepID=A0A1H0T6N6_9MICO|nr:NlpC/P60 family protein [Pedococcus dokdonensis]SDP49400.1 Cell wall-associated hydrolase, NlpC family [Pedococcus dokdonensis]